MPNLLRLILELLFWTFATAVVMGLCAVAVAVGVAPVAAYAVPALLIIVAPMIALIARAVRRRRERAVLTYLEQAVRLNLPLARMMHAAEHGERGVIATRLADLRHFLEHGFAVAEAVESSLPEAPARTIVTLAAAEQIGQLKPALARLMRHAYVSDDVPDPTQRPFTRIYPVVLIGAIGTIGMMFAIFVLPKYQQIFLDFQIQLPQITRRTTDVLAVAGPLVMLFGSIAVLVLTGRYFFEVVRPFGVELTSLGIVDRVRWILPFSHALVLNHGMTETCAFLSDAIEAGVPFDRALTEASRLPINEVLQARLLDWADRVIEGQPFADAAKNAGMPGLVVGMLATVINADDIVAVFRFFERHYRWRFSRLQYLLHAMVVPLVVLVLGVAVAFVAMAMFLPLLSLINSLSSQINRF